MTTALLLRTSISLAVVIGLLAGFVWALRRGLLGGTRPGARAGIAVETAVALGERRSLVIVAVEGRRLLLGLTPGSVTHLADLAPVGPVEKAS